MIEIEGSERYWDVLAGRYWLIGPPLRPSAPEVRIFEQLIARYARPPLHALMLGVTPAHAGIERPGAIRLLAVDRSFAMVRGIWPGDIPRVRQAVCGDWSSLPVADHCCSLVIGDGSANCVRFPNGLRKLAAEVVRVLHPEGCLLLRCYAQLEQKEDPECVVASLRSGECPSFHAFKFRLFMALQPDAARGVVLDDVYRCWAGSGIDPVRLAEERGWELEVVRALEACRDSRTVHTFPTLAEFRAVLGEYFEELSCSLAPYPLAERCPVLALKPRGGK